MSSICNGRCHGMAKEGDILGNDGVPDGSEYKCCGEEHSEVPMFGTLAVEVKYLLLPV